MPIEINELVVRARVGDAQEAQSNSSAPGASPSLSSANAGTPRDVQVLEKAVEEALNLIKRKNER